MALAWLRKSPKIGGRCSLSKYMQVILLGRDLNHLFAQIFMEMQLDGYRWSCSRDTRSNSSRFCGIGIFPSFEELTRKSLINAAGIHGVQFTDETINKLIEAYRRLDWSVITSCFPFLPLIHWSDSFLAFPMPLKDFRNYPVCPTFKRRYSRTGRAA